MHRLVQRAWDIGLAPLNDNLYNRCKSNNKFREYAACGIAGVYSALPTYADCVEHEQTGLLTAQTEEAWYAAIRRLIEDRALRKHIRRQARSYAREHYTIARCADEWLLLLLRSAAQRQREKGVAEDEAGSGLRKKQTAGLHGH